MIMLAMFMCNAELGLKILDLKTVIRKKKVLLAGLSANLTIPVLYIFAMTIVIRLSQDLTR
jgi:BASS family bile acid:Na+ symporter